MGRVRHVVANAISLRAVSKVEWVDLLALEWRTRSNADPSSSGARSLGQTSKDPPA